MKKAWLILVIASALVSCKSENDGAGNKVIIENLIGDWKVLESTRNNRVAKSLSNAEFYISDSTFSCNFLHNSDTFPYSFNGNKIDVLSPDKNSFSVRFLTPDTLILNTEIKNFDFKFISVKKEDYE